MAALRGSFCFERGTTSRPGLRRLCLLAACAAFSFGVFLPGGVVGQDLSPATDQVRLRFTSVRSVHELPDGRILVTDYGENRLTQVDLEADTTNEHSVGRTGEGPGEYHHVGTLFPLSRDTVLHIDSYNGRWTVVASGVLQEYRRPSGSIDQALASTLRGVDSLNHMLGFQPLGGRRATSADSLAVAFGQRGAVAWDTIARSRGRGSNSAVMRELPRMPNGMRALASGTPLDAEDRIALSYDGWVAIAYVDPYRVDWRTPAGTWINGAPLPFERIRTDSDVKCKWSLRAVPYVDKCDLSWMIGWPGVIPPFVASDRPGIFTTRRGEVVIERVQLVDDGPRTYDVVNRRGELVRTVTLGPRQRIVGFGLRGVYVVSTGELDLQTISRHPW